RKRFSWYPGFLIQPSDGDVVQTDSAARRRHHGRKSPLGERAWVAPDQGARKRGGCGSRLRRRLWGPADRVSHSLCLFGGELAAPENRSDGADEVARAFPAGENAGATREKRSVASDRTSHAFAGGLPGAIAQIDRAN